MIESLHEKGPQVKKNVEMPRRDWLLKALDHLPDSVVKKFRLREKWLGESTEQTEQPEQPVANENSKEVEFTQWKNQLKREDLAPDRAYDPTMRFYAPEELEIIFAQPDAEVQGISEALTLSMFTHYEVRDQVYPIDSIGRKRGDYTLLLSFVPFEGGRKPLNGGRYEIFLINRKLGLKEGSDLSFGGLPVYQKGEQEAAKESGRKLLDGAVEILENYLAGKTQIQSHHELFVVLKIYLDGQGEFEINTRNNPEAFR